MASQIQLRRDTAANWSSANTVLAQGEIGINLTTGQFKIGDGSTAWNSLSYSAANISLNDLGDVTITSAANGDFLRWNGTAWVNDAVNLSTDTVGDYVNTVTASTGVTITGAGGESSSPVFSIGQDVATNASVTFARVTASSASVSGEIDASTVDVATELHVGNTANYDGYLYMNNGAFNVVSGSSAGINIQSGGNGWLTLYSGGKITSGNTPQVEFPNAAVSASVITTTGDVTVGGNLTVNGTTTTLNTETLAVEDNIVLLNSNVTGSPTTNAGIEVERGDSSNVVLRWNESTDSWEVTEDGSTYKNIAVGQDVETTSSVSFAAVTASTFTGNLVGNADTASALQTARTIALGGDLSGSVSFDGSSSVTINATVVNSGVTLDEISDVVITAPEEFQGLSYNGTNWVNSHIPLVSYVRNAEATTITTGTAVYLFGGTGDHASVKRADNGSDTTSSKTIGVAGANIPASNNGPIITRGYVDGIDLSTGYSVGDILWLGENGGFTTTKPISPDHLVFIGVVVRASVNGIIYVATQNGYETGELHDVRTNGKVDKDVLMWNASSSVWVNEQINLGTDTVGNYVADVVQGTGILVTHTPGEGSSASIALNAGLNELTDVSVIDPTEGQLLIRTADGWQNISASGDVTVNASGAFSIAANSVALGTDTTGNYMANVAGGTGVTISHTPGEGSTASVAIGQDVATSASVEFARITMTGPVTGDTTVATKSYVDNVASGIHYHLAANYATAAALPNGPTYSNGTSGVGATLTASASARLVVDGSNVSTGERVLVKNQADAKQNGIYECTEQGSVSVAWVLTRASDSNNSIAGQVKTGDSLFVTGGTANIRVGFTLTSTGSGGGGVHVLGTDDLTFTEFAGISVSTAGTGLVKDGNTLNVATANAGRIVVNADDIDLATVAQTNTSGTTGISFVQSHTVDSYGRVTGTVTADVIDASTSQKGIAQFSSSHFSVSGGSVQIASGAITSTEIANGTITNSDISESAGIGLLKLQSGSSGQIIVANASGVPSYVTPSGDITVNASGVFSIAANSVALGTDTTGNYVATISGTTDQVEVTGSGSENAAVTLSLPQNIATSSSPTFNALTLNGSASIGTNASISSAILAANGQIRIAEDSSQVRVSLRPNVAGIPYEAIRVGAEYNMSTMNTFARIAGINFSGTVVSGIQFTTSTSNSQFSPAITIGPRVLVSGSYASDLSSALISDQSSSVHMTVQRGSSSSVGFMLSDVSGGSLNILEVRDSSSTRRLSVGNSSNNYMFSAESASLTTASIGAADISNLIVGELTVNGTTTTVNSTTVTVDDPIITLGGDTAPTSDDNKDRGVAFRYYSGTAASVGFFGYDDSTGKFTFLTGATNTSEVFSGTNASVQVGALHVVGGVGGSDFVTLSGESSEGRVRVNYASFDQFVEIYSSMSGQIISWKNSAAQTASIQFTSSDVFTFSKPISSASISGATVSGSVGFVSSASVTLPAKTFFPEEYLSVSSSVTLNSTTHRYATLEMTASAGTSVITVPSDASDNFPVGSVIQIIRVGAGEVQVTASAGATVNNALGNRLRAQWSTATLRKRAANTWLLSGDLKV